MHLRPHTLLLFLVFATVSYADHYHPYRNVKSPKVVVSDEYTKEFWQNEAAEGIEKRLKRLQNTNKARNIIMFLGDGMSIPTLAATRIYKGQKETPPKNGEESQLFFETFPTVGLSKTYCIDQQIADSACSATAYLCGVKTNEATIGVTAEVTLRDCEASNDPATNLNSIAAWALDSGRDAGIVTTTRVTHASPAGTYARIAARDWESDKNVVDDGKNPEECRDIAHQLVHTSPGNKFKVILGGGRRAFLSNETVDEEGDSGIRLDKRNLIEEWQELKRAENVTYKYVWNRAELMALRDSPPEYILGLFETSHCKYHLETDDNEPSLAEMTEVAIRSLNRNEKGFFLFVEGGRIDHAHHDNFIHKSVDETLEMDLAIQRAAELLSEEDTLMVVTADHAHVMSFNGYSVRGNNILGTSTKRGDDGIPYMTLSYANGPGAREPVNNQRVDVTQDSTFGTFRFQSHAEVPLDSETHGGDDVAVFAWGPYHHMFSGLYEQSQIPYLMAYAACIGPGLHSCNGAFLHHPLAVPIYLIALMVVWRNMRH